jgi:hypothetical protein
MIYGHIITTMIYHTMPCGKYRDVICLKSAGRTWLSRHGAHCWLNPSHVWLLRHWSGEVDGGEFVVFSIPLRVRLEKTLTRMIRQIRMIE